MDLAERRGEVAAAAEPRKRLNAIGLASRSLIAIDVNWYVQKVTESIARRARTRRQDFVTFNSQTTENIACALPVFRERCDGILHMGFSINPDAQEAFREAGMPLVLVNGKGEGEGSAYVDIDNVRASQDLTSHLIGLGHRRIAMFRGPDNDVANDRVVGFQQALQSAGLGSGVIFPCGYTMSHGEDAARSLFELPKEGRPTAIVCFNDLTALGALTVASRLGIRIPSELSVVGIDDLVESSLSRPGLTTIRQLEVGEMAVDLLLDIIEGNRPMDYAQIVPHQLIVRGSTAPPPID